eukprot:TRINITY_DN12009_c0_g1_i1.p1 TRINITY_DN12009_c0_g1~~TRINITY_DN12009_c0_g1_i1.p1  ORF type:complete len:103 (+),score=24.39 TRINITY_DN12009_c0_g1_i1:51-359(+)
MSHTRLQITQSLPYSQFLSLKNESKSIDRILTENSGSNRIKKYFNALSNKNSDKINDFTQHFCRLCNNVAKYRCPVCFHYFCSFNCQKEHICEKGDDDSMKM